MLFSGPGNVTVVSGTVKVAGGSTAFCNTGDVVINSSATVNLAAGANLMGSGVDVTSYGTITGDEFEVPGGSSFISYGSASISVNTMVVASAGALGIWGTSSAHANVSLTVAADAQFDSVNVFTCDGTVMNSGQINQSGGAVFQVTGVFTNNGDMYPGSGFAVTGGIVNNGFVKTYGYPLTGIAVTGNNYLITYSVDSPHTAPIDYRSYAASIDAGQAELPVLPYASGDVKFFESWQSTSGTDVIGTTPFSTIASGGTVALHERHGTFETVLPIAAGVPSTGYTSTGTGQHFQWKIAGADVSRPGSTTATITPLVTDLGSTLQLNVSITYPDGYYATQSALYTFAPVKAAPTVVIPDSVAPGTELQISGSDLGPSSTYRIELHSTPVVLGSITTSAAGTFGSGFVIPRGTAAGTHQVVVYDPNGNIVATADITVTAGPNLAATGATTDYDWFVGAGALLLGLALLVVARRRRASSDM